MTDHDANPYVPPETPEVRRPRINWWAYPMIGLLTALASAAAFLGTCLPLGYVAFGLSYPVSTPLGEWLWVGAWGGGLAAAVAAGTSVARGLLRTLPPPAEDVESEPDP